MRVKCKLCKWWDKDKRRFVYGKAEKTDWLPEKGIEFHLRQFRCKTCGGLTYKMLTIMQLNQVHYKDEQKRQKAEIKAQLKAEKEKVKYAKTTNPNHS